MVTNVRFWPKTDIEPDVCDRRAFPACKGSILAFSVGRLSRSDSSREVGTVKKVVVAIILLSLPTMLFAHHSVNFYEEAVTRVAGELVEVQWRNPHVGLTIEVVSDRGVPEIWQMETSSIYPLERAGVTRDILSVGRQIVIIGRRSTREVSKMLALRAQLRDGTDLPLWFQFTPENYDDEGQLVDAATENVGIFRVWSVPAANMFEAVEQLADQPFTQSAIDARASWDMLDNFAIRCEPEGLPRIMVNPHPFEFIDQGSEIILRAELYDVERVIHMDTDSAPDEEPWSRLGYSVGHWEGGDFIVRTTRANWPFFDTIGTPLSEDVEIEERYSLSADQSRLDFEITITDPSTFTSPAHLDGYWLSLGESIQPYDCQR